MERKGDLMDDKRIEAFAVTYELGSLAAAARHLGIPYRKAQDLVKALEVEERCELFLRTQWGMIPTGTGRDRYAKLPGNAKTRASVVSAYEAGGGL